MELKPPQIQLFLHTAIIYFIFWNKPASLHTDNPESRSSLSGWSVTLKEAAHWMLSPSSTSSLCYRILMRILLKFLPLSYTLEQYPLPRLAFPQLGSNSMSCNPHDTAADDSVGGQQCVKLRPSPDCASDAARGKSIIAHDDGTFLAFVKIKLTP